MPKNAATPSWNVPRTTPCRVRAMAGVMVGVVMGPHLRTAASSSGPSGPRAIRPERAGGPSCRQDDPNDPKIGGASGLQRRRQAEVREQRVAEGRDLGDATVHHAHDVE